MNAVERGKLERAMVTAGCGAYAVVPDHLRAAKRMTAGLSAASMIERIAEAMLREIELHADVVWRYGDGKAMEGGGPPPPPEEKRVK